MCSGSLFKHEDQNVEIYARFSGRPQDIALQKARSVDERNHLRYSTNLSIRRADYKFADAGDTRGKQTKVRLTSIHIKLSKLFRVCSIASYVTVSATQISAKITDRIAQLWPREVHYWAAYLSSWR